MLLYEVTVSNKVFGGKDKLLSTTDKVLAEATVDVLNSTFLNKTSYAYLNFKQAEDVKSSFAWWYDESFSVPFLHAVWEEMKNKGINPYYTC